MFDEKIIRTGSERPAELDDLFEELNTFHSRAKTKEELLGLPEVVHARMTHQKKPKYPGIIPNPSMIKALNSGGSVMANLLKGFPKEEDVERRLAA